MIEMDKNRLVIKVHRRLGHERR